MAYLMVVDDDEDFAAVVGLILRHAGHEVVIQSDTASAMAEMQRRPPDLLILDVMFPGDNFAGFDLARAMRGCSQFAEDDSAGLGLARAMRGCSSLKRVPILMLTGLNQQMGLALSTLDTDNSWLPVSDFVEKPVKAEELVSKVRSLLQAAGPQEGPSP